MRLRILSLALLFALAACQDESRSKSGYPGRTPSGAPGNSNGVKAPTVIPKNRLIFKDSVNEKGLVWSFSVETGSEVARVSYHADGDGEALHPLGTGTSGEGFPLSYTFSKVGNRRITAVAFDAQNKEINRATAGIEVVAEKPAELPTKVPGTPEPAPLVKAGMPGAWVFLVQQTGMSHAQLATKLKGMGYKRVYIKTVDGASTCSVWPELCDPTIPGFYHKEGLQVYAWSYNRPGKEMTQADAINKAIQYGYDGYVLDIEKEYDGKPELLEVLLKAFVSQRNKTKTPTSFPIYATTWGNPIEHNMSVEVIDKYVEAHMPQTYVEKWGGVSFANVTSAVKLVTCEYEKLGTKKPIHHIISDEDNIMTTAKMNEFFKVAGSEASIWRTPGEEIKMERWDLWKSIDLSLIKKAPASCQ